MKVKLSTKPLSVAVGLVVGLVSVATIAAPTINVEATKNVGFVKTTKMVNDIKVEIEAPATVDVQPLLNAMPAVTGSDAVSKVDNALDTARQKLLPKVAMSIVVSKANKPQTTSTNRAIVKATTQTIDVSQAVRYVNRSLGLNQWITTPSKKTNGTACFVHVRTGKIEFDYQNNANINTWYYRSTVTANNTDAFAQGGNDTTYKGCAWKGLNSANTGDFVAYFYN
ncbi:MAG: hypothetical protein ACRCR4_14855 [Thiotrichaceae bacterium]|uniref:Uncharacterized protein n=1 Tax=Candidatus Thiocaldithrix dubininis TaxID=3080823 RepID=A0AA95KF39_9GAMM|nr:MAG: hypothetical protein QJT80_02875 [Candidatus Thiocaldithrix dubininis]